MKHADVVPGWVQRMSRRRRLALFAIVMIMTVVIVIPGYIMGTGYLVGLGACDRPDLGSSSSICSPLGRLLFTGLGIAVGVPLARSWARFLARILALAEDAPPSQSNLVDRLVQGATNTHSVALPFGQRLTSGAIEFEDRSNHCIIVKGEALTFWSMRALQKGWLKTDDQLVLVYQGMPLVSSLKLALAFCKRTDSLVHGVAAGMQTASMLIAAFCVVTLATLRPPFSELFIGICILLIVANAAYLLLMMRAKSALYEFMSRETNT